MKGIDATNIYCPDFTMPVLRLIKKYISVGDLGVIKTKEARSFKRLEHLCLSYGWTVKHQEQKGDLFYTVISRDS